MQHIGWNAGNGSVKVGSSVSIINLEMYAGSTTLRMTIKSATGNVGIGTTSPQADLHIYRVGYDKKDRADQAFKSFKIPLAIIHAANKSQKHTVFADCNFGVFDFYIDTVDKEHKINPTDKNANIFAPSGVNLNPIGIGNNFISFPMLSDIGFATNEGESARFSE